MEALLKKIFIMRDWIKTNGDITSKELAEEYERIHKCKTTLAENDIKPRIEILEKFVENY